MATTNITVSPGDAQTAALINSGENVDGTLVAGAIQMASVLVTFGSNDHATNDVVNLVRLPKGATIIVDQIKVRTTDTFGASVTDIDLGDDDTAGVGAAADADRYLAQTVCTSAQLQTNVVGVAATTPYTLGASAWIRLKLHTVTAAATGALRLWIPFIIRN